MGNRTTIHITEVLDIEGPLDDLTDEELDAAIEALERSARIVNPAYADCYRALLDAGIPERVADLVGVSPVAVELQEALVAERDGRAIGRRLTEEFLRNRGIGVEVDR